MADQLNTTRNEPFSITHFVIRVVAATVVLGITAFFTRGFAIDNLWSLIVGAIVLSVLDYMASRLLGVNAKPFGRGITGFILAAAIIYITQYFVAGYNVSLWGAIIGAFVYGIVDAIIPGRAM